MDFKTFSKLIMIEQTLFALPFALLGVLFAGGGTPMTWVWVIIALAAARTAGMSFNRVIDAEIDARNPRTRNRLIPSGEVRPGEVWLVAIASSLVLVGAAFMLNRFCFYLSFLAVFLLFTYAYFKRFSASSHFYLGLVEAAAPIGGYIAVTGSLSIVSLLLGVVILTWIAGLDIVYALQDQDFDKNENLHSIPVRMGKEGALVLSTLCYILSMGALIIAGLLTQRQAPFWIAIFLVGIIFTVQQRLARRANTARAVGAFFKINTLVSPILFFGTLVDILMP